MRQAAFAVDQNGMAAAGARVWLASAAANPTMRNGYCGGFVGITLTHKSTVRPEGLPGGDAG